MHWSPTGVVAAAFISLLIFSCSTSFDDLFEAGATTAGGGSTVGTSSGGRGGSGSGGAGSGASTGCATPCFSDECCNTAGECVPGDANTTCGNDGNACRDCTVDGGTCGSAGPTSNSEPRACLPPCAGGHFRAAVTNTAYLYGFSGADDLCAATFGAGWHFVEQWVDADAAEHGGSDLAGVCHGNWCTDIDWGSVSHLLAARSCQELTAPNTSTAEGITIQSGCAKWASGQCDCSDVSACGSGTGSRGILCTDLP